jgi:hypothetical protein
MDFNLPLGIDISDISGLSDGFVITPDNPAALTVLLSSEKLLHFLLDFTKELPEPIFFFIELPCTLDEEKSLKSDNPNENSAHYKLYYLDNCTKPVISAIIKEYGSLLVNDGVCRFGFGGNESGDEIYVQTYKVMSLYCTSPNLRNKALSLLENFGAENKNTLLTPWDIISPDNPGTCVCIEDDGITVFDLPDLLADAGMYFSEII